MLTFTAADIGTVPVFRRLRGRAAIYNELLRAIVDGLGVDLVDFWRLNEFRDPRMWDGDRIHLSPVGHQQIAVRVLEQLAIPHALTCPVEAETFGSRRQEPPRRFVLGRNLCRAVGVSQAATPDTGGRHRAEAGDDYRRLLTRRTGYAPFSGRRGP